MCVCASFMLTLISLVVILFVFDMSSVDHETPVAGIISCEVG